MIHRYITTLVVEQKHLDDLQHVNNVQYLYWAQEIAKTHWNKLKSFTGAGTAVWMVRNHDVAYKRGAFLGDVLRIETHLKEVKGPLSLRIVEFFDDKTDQLLVRCKTQWCYVDPSNRKTIDIPDGIRKCFLSPHPVH